MTFDTTVTSTGALFADPKSSEKSDVEGVDEVLFDCCLRNTADSGPPRSTDC
jgi:hypothetical protein